MEEDGEVSRTRLERVDALETAAGSIDLTRRETGIDAAAREEENPLTTHFRYLFLLRVKVVIFCSDDLGVEEVWRATHNALGTRVLRDICIYGPYRH